MSAPALAFAEAGALFFWGGGLILFLGCTLHIGIAWVELFWK